MPAASNSGPDIRIMTATNADTARMIPLVNAAFAVETFLEGTRTDAQRMVELTQKGQFLLAEEGSSGVVACVYLERRGERGYFGMLAVDPSAQGRGLGRLMVDAAENHWRQRGCTFMDITVLSLRPELPPFYRKLGYTETGTEEFRTSRPFKDGVECHCIVMSKPL
jgi:ribosomal protein S18 acetylase RimI-like enzyme